MTAGGAWFATDVDQEIAIDVRGDAAGAAVSHVNGAPITLSTPVDIGGAWVQLREDGRLTVSPNAGFAGRVAIDCTLSGTDGRLFAQRAVVDVVGDPAGAAHAETAAAMGVDIKLAEIAANDNSLGIDGLAQAGLYADMFKIVGTGLYLRAGVELEFGTEPALSIDVVRDAASAGDGHDNGAALSGLGGDVFVFASMFREADRPAKEAPHEVIDVSSSGFATFQELLDSGALVQDGPDVVLTFDPSDPLHSDRITLRGIDLAALGDSDFKF